MTLGFSDFFYTLNLGQSTFLPITFHSQEKKNYTKLNGTTEGVVGVLLQNYFGLKAQTKPTTYSYSILYFVFCILYTT